MSGQIVIREAGPADAAVLGQLIADLLSELARKPGEEGDAAALEAVAARLLAVPDRFTALIAEDEAGQAQAALTLSQCAALYAGGIASDLGDGLARAREALESGAAVRKLEALKSRFS